MTRVRRPAMTRVAAPIVTRVAAPVIEGVRRAASGALRFGGGTATAQFSVSDTGSVAYVPGPSQSLSVTAALQNIEIFDRAGGAGQFSIVRVTTTPAFAFSVVEPSAQGRMGLLAPSASRPYDVAPDGNGMIGLSSADPNVSAGTTQIEVVLNWFDELRARVP